MKTKPLSVTVGGFTVRIYPQKNRDKTNHVVTWSEGGKRQRKSFADPKEAKEFARLTADRLSGIGGASVTLSTAESLAYTQAMRRLGEHGTALDTAIWEWSEAKKIIGDGDLLAAAKLFAEQHRPSTPVPIPEVIARFIAWKRECGLSAGHIRDLSGRLKTFSDAFLVPFQSLRHEAIQVWVKSLKVANRTKNNFLTAIQALVSFAERTDVVPVGLIGMEKIQRYAKTHADVVIFTPDEMRTILRMARPELIPFLAISAFAGLRHAEVDRMTWDQVHFETDEHFPHGWIELKARQSKNAAKLGARARRLIPMQANLRAWLEPRKMAADEPICRLETHNQLRKFAVSGEMKWKRNGLRHSYGSYRMALTNDEGKVALEMGNSPDMIFAHYRRVVSPTQAEAWFGIVPDEGALGA